MTTRSTPARSLATRRLRWLIRDALIHRGPMPAPQLLDEVRCTIADAEAGPVWDAAEAMEREGFSLESHDQVEIGAARVLRLHWIVTGMACAVCDFRGRPASDGWPAPDLCGACATFDGLAAEGGSE